MKRNKLIVLLLLLFITAVAVYSCTKVGNGFISPTMQYNTKLVSIPKGQIVKSTAIVPDGSDIPLNVRWTHIYDSTGKIVDDIFNKTYPIDVWSSAYNPATDTTFSLIMAKRVTSQITPVIVIPESGIIQSTSASIYIPAGRYTMDIEVTNAAGTLELKKAMTLNFYDGPTLMMDDGGYTFSFGRLIANTATGAANTGNVGFYAGLNSPYVIKTVTKISDQGNQVIVKITDRNGVVFNPRLGEIAKRPRAGVNPVPPYLGNLQDYTKDTYVANDTAMTFKYPLTPFPIAPFDGNGYNMYYRIPAAFVTIDSATTFTPGQIGPGIYYKGTADPHYLGTFKNDLYDFSVRIPFRIFVPGSYYINLKLLPVVHR